MLRALHTAATGAESQQFNIDVISNNVANVNTTSYKKTRTEFQDLLSQTYRSAGALNDSGTTVPTPIQVGMGVKVSATQKIFLPGAVVQTGNPLDVAIDGDGFFQVQREDGTTVYTRDGSFKRDASGQLVTSAGLLVQPAVTIPANTLEIVITTTGAVSVRQPGTETLTQIGQLQLVRFSNPSGLESIGKNLYSATPASGDPIQGQPGQGDLGGTTLQQGYLEGSNVQLVEELIGLISAQRAFEANTNIIKSADQMLQRVTNIVG